MRVRVAKPVVYHAVVLALSFVMIYPLMWLVASSFKGPSEIFANMTTLVPQRFTLANYRNGWAGFGGVSFATFFRNSVVLAGLSTLGTVLSSAVIAYGFARVRFVGRDFWFACMIATLMLPIQVQLIPQYILFNALGWVNTFLPLTVPRFFGGSFFIFLIVQFIRGIPLELDESAEIDGASRFDVFCHIILPLIKPALITASIFSFYWTWEDFLGPLLYLNDPMLYPVSLALKNFADPSAATDWGAIFAMSVLSLIPVVVIFVWLQRYLVEGIQATGLKG